MFWNVLLDVYFNVFFMQWRAFLNVFRGLWMFLSALWCWRLLAVERGAAREHMRREAWRGNVPTSLQFPWLEVRLLGALAPNNLGTSFTLQSGGVFPLTLLSSFIESPEVTSSALVHFICLSHHIRGSLWCVPVRDRKWCDGLSWKRE